MPSMSKRGNNAEIIMQISIVKTLKAKGEFALHKNLKQRETFPNLPFDSLAGMWIDKQM